MFIKRYGTGKGIYIGLHGWSGDHTTFAPLVPYLPERVTWMSVDLPGCGRSPAPREWSLEAIGLELAVAVNALAVDDLTLVGSCSGGLYGLVAARLNSEFRQRIKRLVLIDPYAYFPWYFRVFVDDRLGKIGWYAYYASFANPPGRWLTNLSLRRHRVDDAHLTRSFTVVNHAVTYRYLKLLRDIPGVAWFADFHLPTDIVCGEKTFGAAKESARRWQKVWPQAQYHELKGAGHLPLDEAVAPLSRIIFAPEAEKLTE